MSKEQLQLVMCQGLPGSGKSTWAKEILNAEPGKWKRINKDSLREMLDDGCWSKSNEKFVVAVRDSLISHALVFGYNVIVDDTNFASIHQETLQRIADEHKAQFSVKEFDTPLDECIKRDLQRLDSVGEVVIRKMWRQYAQPKIEAPEWVEGVPKAIIVDLDGTLAKLGSRNPYDASTCEDDEVDAEVAYVISMFRNVTDVILCSGREDKYWQQTVTWLDKNDVEYDKLFMRKSGDFRKDAVIKREIFDEKIRGGWNVVCVIDDRSQVVRMWRDELGLKCWQVADGEF